MQKYSTYILDDEPLAIKVIEQHLQKFPFIEICGTSTEPLLALAEVKQLQPHLLFLDIQMPQLTGLDFISVIQNSPAVVITTAYREYAVQGFDLNVLDYLVKPIPFKRFAQTIDKFLTSYQAPSTEGSVQESDSVIFIKADRKNIRLALADILYVEGVKDYVKIVLPNQTLLTKISIGNFLMELPQEDFIRIHKSFIVAKNKITAFTARDVEIGKKEIPIGRSFKADFMQVIKATN